VYVLFFSVSIVLISS